ncbi:DNA polymerase theta [Anopheles ziemanni]|uniref:DNA polymerase theta n=1 Tax=Anopheles coustani TaxID=139045 RepID=UPI00265ACC17|nr:DNA polymerase theta [Anopheles coustani]XP_058168339.1 DNA polymerase theta [Anopheles ziemanni]
MTEFSQSLQLGENTLETLERQLVKPFTPPSVNAADRRTTRSSQGQRTNWQSSTEEVIEESPTNVKGSAELSRQRSVRERLQIISTQSRTRKTSKRTTKRTNSTVAGSQCKDQQVVGATSKDGQSSSHVGEKENIPDGFVPGLPLGCPEGGIKSRTNKALVDSFSRAIELNCVSGDDDPSPEKMARISNNEYDDLFQSSIFSVDAARSQTLQLNQENPKEASYHTLFDQSDFTLDKYDRTTPGQLPPEPTETEHPLRSSLAMMSMSESEQEIFSETVFDRAISSDLMIEEGEEHTGLEESLRVTDSANDTIEDVLLNIENVTFSQPLGPIGSGMYRQHPSSEQSNDVLDLIESDKTGSGQTVQAMLTTIRNTNDSVILSENCNRTQSTSLVKEPREHLDCSMSFDNSNDLRSLASWGLPTTVTDEYAKKGIVELFQWQVDCLSQKEVLLEGKNLVYSAPTSAGKTLVSEFLMAKTIAERKLKVLLILPFVAVAREKMLYLRDLLASSGMRVEGFYGGYHPPGGFESVDLAVCTIEKANSIVNRLLEQSNLSSLGMVVVDEAHLISDPSRGYILELLLTKIRFVAKQNEHRIQVVCMSATLPNIDLLARWLEAELFHTDFRPIELVEMIKIGNTIFGAAPTEGAGQALRVIDGTLLGCPIPNDPDHVALLCLETILEGCSVIVFCPSKDWCEQLAIALASTLHGLRKESHPHRELSERIKGQFDGDRLEEVLLQLRNCPAALDSVLEKTVRYGVAFHHAGLTTDERDIIEASFRDGALRIIVATSTLSSGVNLPARRVIVRTPKFGGRQMSALTYKQMIGRAGRKGRDTLGESVLICSPTEEKIGRELVGTVLPPVRSCLDSENYTHLNRAVLEIIASGSASTTKQLESFVNTTLYSCERGYQFEVDDQLILSAKREQKQPPQPPSNDKDEKSESDPIASCIEFLLEYEFIRLLKDDAGATEEKEDAKMVHLSATRLGHACLAASLPPKDGFLLFSELQKARQCFVLESELHAVYLVTPYSVAYQWQQIDWMDFLDLWEKLPVASKRVGELVGVKESFMVRAMRGTGNLDYRALQIHKRFYTALALLELVNEVPLCTVARKFKCCRGLLQSLQQISATFAGIVTSFCHALHWTLVQLIVSQFRERLFFGVAHELLGLMRIPSLNGQRARLLYDGGIPGLAELANADRLTVEKILYNRTSFEAERLRENENEYDAARRKNLRNLYLTGRAGMTVEEAARLLIQEARTFLQLEHGLENPNWTTQDEAVKTSTTPAETSTVTSTNSVEQQSKRQDQSSNSVLSRVDSSVGCSGQFHNSLLMTDLVRPADNDDRYPKSLRIVDVCADRLDFEQFLKTVNEYDRMSVACGVARDESVPPDSAGDVKIGGHLLKKVPHAAVAFYGRHSKRSFTFDCDLYLAGVGITGCKVGQPKDDTVYYMDLQNGTVIGDEEKRQTIRTLLQKEGLSVTLLDAKDQVKVFYNAGLLRSVGVLEEVLATVQDPRVACWLMQTEEKTLTVEAMIARHCPGLQHAELRWTGQRWISPKWIGYGMNHHSPIDAKQRCAVECLLVDHLMESVLDRLAADGGETLLTCFSSREMPVQLALARCELDGFPVDRPKLCALIAHLKASRERIAEDARKLNGNRRLDFGSSRAVAIALRLAAAGENSKRVRTTRQTLERLDSPLAALVIAYRKIESNLTRTIEPLYRTICPRTGRIHGRSFCYTSTGRITMHEPNLQTVVKDFDVPCSPIAERFSCRSTFICSHPGVVLLSADFCQLELCILTHLSQDRRLMEALSNDSKGKRDVFRSLAARWNRLDKEADVSEELRNRTKAIVYGVIYGMGVRSMAAELQIDEDAARTLMEQFHASYPDIRRYTERVVQLTRQLGYIETLTGRRRYLPAINSPDSSERAEAERQAVCTTIQGSAADILKNAIVRMVRNLRKYRDVLDLSTIRLVLHLHDELIYEVPRGQLPKVAKILRSSMENCAKLSVPLRVKLKAGSSWGKLEELSL